MKRIFHILICCALMALSIGCSKETLSGSSAGPAPISPPEPEFTGPDPNAGLDVRKMAAAADSYAITYGTLTPAAIETLKKSPLVIIHPYYANATRSQVMRIKQGVDPDDPSDNVVVLCYISIGEDDRTYAKTDAEMRLDPRFTGDGSGPSIDPRGAAASGTSLVGINPLGIPTNGGFASYYLNDNAVRCKGNPDKSPDIDINFNVRFVNAGDPRWYDLLNNSIMDQTTNTPSGFKEMFNSGVGRSLGCDGVFLDTIDTAAPNFYTSCSDADYSSSEWTAKGFTDFIQRLRSEYPDKVILQNRGLFYFDPRRAHYEVSARGIIDIGFFESYRSGNDQLPISTFFIDNKFNSAPKLMAEANRPDGFKVLSLGYADGFGGPKPGIDINTLLGTSTIGFNDLIADITEAHAVGFRHYITSANVDFVNTFVKDNEVMTDLTPPQWSSVYNINYDPAGLLVPRVGVQKAVVGSPGSVTLSWDVALDMNKVSYVLYYKTTPFNFASEPALSSGILLNPSIGTGYSTVWNNIIPSEALQQVYPYQQTISGLQQGVTHYFLIRARDSKGNEDTNQVVLTATP